MQPPDDFEKSARGFVFKTSAIWFASSAVAATDCAPGVTGVGLLAFGVDAISYGHATKIADKAKMDTEIMITFFIFLRLVWMKFWLETMVEY